MNGEGSPTVVRASDFSGFRVFSSHSSESRDRRPTDIVLAIICALGVAFATRAAPDALVESGDRLVAFLDSMPGLFNWIWALSYDALVVSALFAIGLAMFAHGRNSLLRDQFLALIAATVLTVWAGSVNGAGWKELLAGFDGTPPATFPAVRLALTVAVIATSSPHLGRPIRQIGRWVVGLGMVSSVMLGVSLPLGVIGALCIGFGSAAMVHLVFGSPGGLPTFDQIRDSLAELGVRVATIEDSEIAARGVVTVKATTVDGTPMLVKVHGRDAWEGQLVAVIFTRIWYRGDAPDVSLNLRSLVEHEAFLSMLAEHQGVPVRAVLAAGVSISGDAIFAADAPGVLLSEMAPEDISAPVLDGAWAAVARMHDADIAHGRMSARCLSVSDDRSVFIGDFAAAVGNANEGQKQTDDAQLLITTALRAGPERAIDAAIRALGPEGVAGLLPLLQSAVMPFEDRSAVDLSRDFLENLRSATAAAIGVGVPKLAPLRRLTLAWAVKVTLLLAFAYWLMTSVTGMDLASVSSAIAHASQGWIWGALLVGVVATVAQAFSTMGASVVDLSFPPSFALQLAVQFTALFIPSSAARVALCVRFFQKMGQSITAATAVGVVDSVAGFTVQVLLIITLLLSGLATLNLHVWSPDTTGSTNGSPDWALLALILAVLVGVGIVVAVKVRKARAFVRDKWDDIKDVARNLRSFRRDLELFLGNLAGQILLALALDMCLRAFGIHASLADLILVNTCVSLFAGLMPVPGGMGVSEAALTTGLMAIGVPEDVAVSTAIVYRLVTFYLPPAWGWFGLRWLRLTDKL